MYEKLKSYIADDTLFIAILLILVSLASFGLGRQSGLSQVSQAQNNAMAGITLTQPMAKNHVNITSDVSVVASRSGTKYHLPHCPGATQIKPDNKIEFRSIEQAEAAGYTPAANCPGL